MADLTAPTDAEKLDLIAWGILKLLRKVDQLMSEQQGLDADVAALTTALGDVSTQTATVVTDVAAVQAEIAALQQQVANGQPVDLTKLDQLAQGAAATTGNLDTAVTGLTGLVPPATPPATS